MGQNEILRWLRENPGWQDSMTIVASLSISRGGVLNSLRKLRKYELVRWRTGARNKHWYQIAD